MTNTTAAPTINLTTQMHETATDQDLLSYYGMTPRPFVVGVDITLTNVEARILAELVGQEESECWGAEYPQIAARLGNLCKKLLVAATAGDAEAAR